MTLHLLSHQVSDLSLGKFSLVYTERHIPACSFPQTPEFVKVCSDLDL